MITFTRAAAREMKERYEKMTGQGSRVAFGTFHSVFFLILKLAYGYQASNIVREEQRIRFIREQAERMPAGSGGSGRIYGIRFKRDQHGKGGNDASCALLSQKLFRRGF